MVDFSSRAYSGYFSPARFDAEVLDCELRGSIPRELDGAFYRMHLDWLYPPRFQDEPTLSADGYISMFRFRNGIADYRGRYVRTDRFGRQLAARKQLYGYYRNPYTDDAEVRNIDNPGERTTANTTPVILAGRLYATKEDGLPYEIDPSTLATRPQTNFGGAWQARRSPPIPRWIRHPARRSATVTRRRAFARATCSCAASIARGTSRSSGASRRLTPACCTTCGSRAITSLSPAVGSLPTSSGSKPVASIGDGIPRSPHGTP